MLNRCHLLFILIILFASCNDEKSVSEKDIVSQISKLSMLGSVEYNFNKLIMTSDEQSYTFGERKILLSCQAHVKAGVDFNKVIIDKFDWNTKEISVNIPKGQIILINIPANEFKTEYQKIGTLRDEFSNNEIQQIQTLAEKEIEKMVTELDITTKAQENARIFIENWLHTFGFRKINITLS